MTSLDIDVGATRTPEQGAHPQFMQRWSPRAFAGVPLTEAELLQLIEAARWAPSCFNSQPWRFVYALKDSPEWPAMLGLLMDMNQVWAQHAGALVAVVSRSVFDNGDAAPTHQFDTGAAWMSMALQASHLGLASHAMWGFHHDQAASVLNLPAEYAVQAMVAFGAPGEVSDLPEKYQEREMPSPRKPIAELAFAGKLP